MTIETSRLIIKSIDATSLSYVFKYLKDISLKIITPREPSSYHIKKFLAFNEKIKLFNSLGYFSVCLKHECKIIGLVSVVPRYLGEDLVNELSYLISEKYQNNSFASEVISKMLDFIFSNTNIQKIHSLVDEDNKISRHILQDKMKFDFVDTFLDSSCFKSIYALDKSKFKCKVSSPKCGKEQC